jgi:hypothetical protein
LETASAAEKHPGDVVSLLEENATELLPKLTNPNGDPGTGEVEKNIVFAGKSGLKITFLHRYCNYIDGWSHRIREIPKEGEYRYLRFAWKSDGLSGMMLQLHDDRDWNIRYHAGANEFGWESRPIAAEPPTPWTLVTIDLFKDFGNREIHGIAFTIFGAKPETAGYFDHVYLGRTIEALDAIDATGFARDKPLDLSAEELETQYKNLSNADASLAYKAFWTLVAAGDPAKALIEKKLGGELVPADATRIALWLKQLDDDDFTVREDATERLKANLSLYYKQLTAERARTTSAEVRARLETILKSRERELGEARRIDEKARRILEIIPARAKN